MPIPTTSDQQPSVSGYPLYLYREETIDWAEVNAYNDMFVESSQMPVSLVRQRTGPAYDDITAIHQRSLERLRKVDPRLTLEVFAAEDYRSPETKRVVSELTSVKLDAVDDVGLARRRALIEFAAETTPQHVSLPQGLLDTPEYAKQGDDPVTRTTMISRKSCLNACFRMAVSAVTGQMPRESSVGIGLERATGALVAEDRLYMDALRTAVFRRRYGEFPLTVLGITGASLQSVASITEALKSRKPDRKVVAIVSLLSESGLKKDTIIWHANVLLSANKDYVLVHDPSERFSRSDGGRQRRRNIYDFHERWAYALNRVHLVVADPK